MLSFRTFLQQAQSKENVMLIRKTLHERSRSKTPEKLEKLNTINQNSQDVFMEFDINQRQLKPIVQFDISQALKNTKHSDFTRQQVLKIKQNQIEFAKKEERSASVLSSQNESKMTTQNQSGHFHQDCDSRNSARNGMVSSKVKARTHGMKSPQNQEKLMLIQQNNPEEARSSTPSMFIPKTTPAPSLPSPIMRKSIEVSKMQEV